MKILGHVEICNRVLPSLNIRGKGRSQWSSLAIGKQYNSENEFFILHKSKQNQLGTKYKITENIEKVFTRFADEGKATIRVKEPPHDICIKTNSLELKTFLRTLQLALQNKLHPQALKQPDTKPTFREKPPKLEHRIMSKNEYPTLEGFHRTTIILEICNAEQNKFDSRILRLCMLKVLNLGNNNLTSLPDEVGSVFPQLESLTLTQNKLGEVPAYGSRWKWLSGVSLSKSLRNLDLSKNNMSVLPRQVCKLKNLNKLNVEENKLSELPPGIGNLRNLRNLIAGHNLLQSLPGSMKRLRLFTLDLSHNLFDSLSCPNIPSHLGVPSLLECAAKRVLKSRLFYSAEVVPYTLVPYLDNAHYCVCGSACFETFSRKYVPLRLKNISETVIMCNSYNIEVVCDAYFCSNTCMGNK